MQELEFPEWQEAVLDALAEYHADKVQEKLRLAEIAIAKRLTQDRNLSVRETLALQDALKLLEPLLKRQPEKKESGEGVA